MPILQNTRHEAFVQARAAAKKAVMALLEACRLRGEMTRERGLGRRFELIS